MFGPLFKAPAMPRSKDSGGFAETVKTVVYAVLIALFVRTFFFEPFNIPSGSMIPTLLVGDYLFVSKYSYGYSRHSLPFSPPLISGSSRAWFSEPERGDVAVFKLPTDNRTDYIKRIVGLPGDSIQLRGSVLYVNGDPVSRERVEDAVYTETGVVRRAARYRETLPSGRTYYVVEQTETALQDTTPVFNVPPGHYFAMGDNRDRSRDSRFLDEVGMIPAENLVGRAEMIFFSIDGTAWKVWEWFSSLRASRMFSAIR
jgi:signal peptidase I